MELLFFLIISVFASEENETRGNSAPNITENAAQNSILVKIEEDEYIKKHISNSIGVRYHKQSDRWQAERWSKKERKFLYNGSYKDEETAAHASDTLARKLMANGEQKHKLNFPDDHIEVYPEKKQSKYRYFGVRYNECYTSWSASRWSKKENKIIYNGNYQYEEAAAHASDTLARKLMANGEQKHKLNFPNDDIEVYAEKITSSIYTGVSYHKTKELWGVSRRSKSEKKLVYNGYYKDEESAARASDTLARKLIANGEQKHKLNFDDIEMHTTNQRNKRKRSENEDLEQFM